MIDIIELEKLMNESENQNKIFSKIIDILTDFDDRIRELEIDS